ncbi:HutD family protein [Pararoseomonas sp. SCSIO 73927]|uniref:HutD/Ves family protein n=1 Tax=Pararoseomonas sp. SCSIO 73927 TaxID=3114537 RepID=UPI0030CAC743
MSGTVIRHAALEPRFWPNGKGLTRTVATGGEGAEVSGWQLGIADLGEAADFSHFPGCNRIFTLLGGEGATLTVDDARLPCLPFVPVAFPGDRPTHYRPEGGAARAFNVVAGRNFEAAVSVLGLLPGHPARVAGMAVFCARGALTVGPDRLGAGDTVLHPGLASIEAAEAGTVAITVGITRRR